jgi:outer membrane protein OmpA-like peptidoglycan-associated protein
MAKRYILMGFIALLAMSWGCASSKKASYSKPMEAITIDVTVLFDFDKYELRDDAKPILKDIAARIRENPAILLVLEGHTDTTGSAKYNEILAEKRARSVGAYLSQEGVEHTRITFVSMGEREPKVQGRSTKTHKQNRRVEIYNM